VTQNFIKLEPVPDRYACPKCGNRDSYSLKITLPGGRDPLGNAHNTYSVFCALCKTVYDPSTGYETVKGAGAGQ
jgi:rubredoxin